MADSSYATVLTQAASTLDILCVHIRKYERKKEIGNMRVRVCVCVHVCVCMCVCVCVCVCVCACVRA